MALVPVISPAVLPSMPKHNSASTAVKMVVAIGTDLADGWLPITAGNHHVPAGVDCHISIFDLHHREDLYPNPSVFDPDRFLPENCVRRHPYAYIPFSAGPRNCIGQKFAMLEMKLVMAEVLRKFELQPVTRPEDLKFVADLVLRNKSAVYVTFAKRNNTTL